MSDTYTSRLGAIKPLPGGSLNTWGSKLNSNNFDIFDAAIVGSSLLTITGDTMLTQADGDSSSTQLPFLHRYGGAPAAAYAVTYTADEWVKLVHNPSGKTATLKVGAGSGAALVTGAIALFAYNSAYGDATLVTPNYVGTGYTVSQDGHVANKLYVDTAVATAGLPATSGTILIDGADTTAGYPSAKFSSARANASFAVSNPGGDEDLQITVAYLALASAAEQTAGFTAVAGSIYPVNIAVSGTLLFPASASNGDMVGISNYGAGVLTFNWNGLKYNGSTSAVITSNKGVGLFRYTNAATGWIDA